MQPLALSDSAPLVSVTLTLSRCPDTVPSVRVSCVLAASDASFDTGNVTSAFAVVNQRAEGSPPPCDPSSAAPVTVLPRVTLGAEFETPAVMGALRCTVSGAQGAAGSKIAVGDLPIVVTPTLWPVWDDLLVLPSNGLLRSVRLGKAVNVTSLLVSMCSLAATPRGNCSGYSAPPDVVLHAAQSTAGAWPLPAVDASDSFVFAQTLVGSTTLILRALRPAFATGMRVTVGGGSCAVGAVSADGLWAVVTTPAPADVCSGGAVAECGYVTLTVDTGPCSSNAAPDSPRFGAALVCPPFCAGAVHPSTAVPAAALVSAGDAALRFTLADPASLAEGGPIRPTALVTPQSSQGIYYALFCSHAGSFPDPTTGVCSNSSDPLSVQCAYGSGEKCITCPSGALCPGGYVMWSRRGYWSVSDTAGVVAACSGPDALERCIGWDVGRGATRRSPAYLQGSYLCGACAKVSRSAWFVRCTAAAVTPLCRYAAGLFLWWRWHVRGVPSPWGLIFGPLSRPV